MGLEQLADFLVDYGRAHLLRVSPHERRRRRGNG
jgi:hypothetical protein